MTFCNTHQRRYTSKIQRSLCNLVIENSTQLMMLPLMMCTRRMLGGSVMPVGYSTYWEMFSFSRNRDLYKLVRNDSPTADTDMRAQTQMRLVDYATDSSTPSMFMKGDESLDSWLCVSLFDCRFRIWNRDAVPEHDIMSGVRDRSVYWISQRSRYRNGFPHAVVYNNCLAIMLLGYSKSLQSAECISRCNN